MDTSFGRVLPCVCVCVCLCVCVCVWCVCVCVCVVCVCVVCVWVCVCVVCVCMCGVCVCVVCVCVCVCVSSCDLEAMKRGVWASFSAIESASRTATSVDSLLVCNTSSHYCTHHTNHVALNTRVESFHFFCPNITQYLTWRFFETSRTLLGPKLLHEVYMRFFSPGVSRSLDYSFHSPCLMSRVKMSGALPPFACEHRHLCILKIRSFVVTNKVSSQSSAENTPVYFAS